MESLATSIPVPTMMEQTSTVPDDADRISLRIWKSGNLRGYNELVERHKKPLFAFISRMIRDAEEAKDVLQETYMRMYNNRDKLREDKKLKSWLFQTANNLCIDLLRKKKPDRVFSVDHQAPETVALFEKHDQTPGYRPDQDYERKHLYGKILEAIDLLPKKQRTIMTLRSCEGLSLNEIAAIMNCSEKTVGTTLFAARKKMMNTLKPVFEDFYGSLTPECAGKEG